MPISRMDRSQLAQFLWYKVYRQQIPSLNYLPANVSLPIHLHKHSTNLLNSCVIKKKKKKSFITKKQFQKNTVDTITQNKPASINNSLCFLCITSFMII